MQCHNIVQNKQLYHQCKLIEQKYTFSQWSLYVIPKTGHQSVQSSGGRTLNMSTTDACKVWSQAQAKCGHKYKQSMVTSTSWNKVCKVWSEAEAQVWSQVILPTRVVATRPHPPHIGVFSSTSSTHRSVGIVLAHRLHLLHSLALSSLPGSTANVALYCFQSYCTASVAVCG